MADTQWLTQAQYDLLASELKERVEVKRVEIARLIDAARQEGDLRENGGYHAARNEQSMNETRIQALQEMLEHAEVGDTPADDGSAPDDRQEDRRVGSVQERDRDRRVGACDE